jgi:hypothetical protein
VVELAVPEEGWALLVVERLPGPSRVEIHRCSWEVPGKLVFQWMGTRIEVLTQQAAVSQEYLLLA